MKIYSNFKVLRSNSITTVIPTTANEIKQLLQNAVDRFVGCKHLN